VAPPAKDSADDAGWSNFEDSDPKESAANGQAEPAEPAEAAAAQRPPADELATMSSEAPTGGFRLQVQLADGRDAILGFGAGDDLPKCISDFVARHGIKDLFEPPLLERVELMAREGRAVDIVDLL